MSEGDGFLGAWRVSEYVYNANGRFAGVVKQRRELRQLNNGRIQVLQQCEPDAALIDHPMGRFTGEHIFELAIDGRARRYHGPAVVGSGLPWGEGAMTGRGVWPHFGHNFTSFAVLAHENRQLTGGKFFNATEMMANVVGVAVPETADSAEQWPTLALDSHYAADLAAEWQGTLRTVTAAGEVINEQPLHRFYNGQQWQETAADEVVFNLHAQEMDNHEQLHGSWHNEQVMGLRKQFGPLCEAEIVVNSAQIVETMELLDGETGYLIGLRRWLRDHQLEKVEVIRLRPQTQ